MEKPIILASQSVTRSLLLKNAGLKFRCIPSGVDESAIIRKLEALKYTPLQTSKELAELKASTVSNVSPESYIIGSDQILSYESSIYSKPRSKKELQGQLLKLSGQKHQLYSACAVYYKALPIWSHVGLVNMTMRNLDKNTVVTYTNDNWPKLKHCVGGYQIESEGIKLFDKIEGDYFNVLGVPLLELLKFLINNNITKIY